MSTTTPGAIVLALRDAVQAVGDAWRLIEQPDQLVSGECDNGYRVLAAGASRGDRATGLPGVQVLEQRFTVELHDTLDGDPAVEDAELLERARRVADSVELSFAGYPAGVEQVLVDDRGAVQRNDATWATVRVGVRVLYQAEIG